MKWKTRFLTMGLMALVSVVASAKEKGKPVTVKKAAATAMPATGHWEQMNGVYTIDQSGNKHCDPASQVCVRIWVPDPVDHPTRILGGAYWIPSASYGKCNVTLDISYGTSSIVWVDTATTATQTFTSEQDLNNCVSYLQ